MSGKVERQDDPPAPATVEDADEITNACIAALQAALIETTTPATDSGEGTAA